MDRNAITGLVLMTLLTIVYFTYFAPKPPPPKENTSTESQTEQVEEAEGITETPTESVTELDPLAQDSIKRAQKVGKYGSFYQLTEGEAKNIEIKTDKFDLGINSKGGAIYSAYLNDYKTFDSLPLPMIDPNLPNNFDFSFYNDNKVIASSDLYFQPSKSKINLTGSDSAKLVLTAKVDDSKALEQVYTFYGDRYDIGYEIRMKGLKDGLGNISYFDINWTNTLPKTELSIDNMRQKTFFAYKEGNSVEKATASDEITEESIKNGFEWLAYKSQFFSTVLIGEKPFRSGKVKMGTPPVEDVNRIMESKVKVDIPRSDDISNRFKIYMGPNEYATLSSYDIGLEKQMDLGWWVISYINVGTTYIFKFLEKYISNYGIIIIILAFIIRTMVLPLTYKSYKSMAKMRVLNATPEMKALDEKHKDDPQKLQMAKMGIYREMGVSMFGGCLPMLLSYPFLIALFFFFPQSVELRQQSFLWANDLSTYDSIFNFGFSIPAYGDHISLFTLLMAISTFVYTFYQQKSQPTAGANPAMKYIAYFMPIVLLIFLNNYASGLSLYYLTSNIISISQTLLIRRTINDEDLLAQMRDTQKQMKGKKGKKKSKSRLEKWVEGQQKKQQEMMKDRKKSAGPNRRSRRK